MIDVVFVHGWSFDKHLWNGILPLLRNARPHMVELGFTGASPSGMDNIPDYSILIGHSLGALWLLQNMTRHPRAFISIGGFDCFFKQGSLRQLREIKLLIRRDPAAMLNHFRAEAGATGLYGETTCNTSLLQKGLRSLETDDEADTLSALPCPAIGLAARDDIIVPEAMSKSIWGKYTLHMRDDGGHTLPFTHPEWCANYIQEQIDAS